MPSQCRKVACTAPLGHLLALGASRGGQNAEQRTGRRMREGAYRFVGGARVAVVGVGAEEEADRR